MTSGVLRLFASVQKFRLAGSVPRLLKDNTANSCWPNRRGKFGPAVSLPLVVPVRAHVRICGFQMQKSEPIVDVDLRHPAITGQAEVYSRLLPTRTYLAELTKRDGKALVKDVIFAFQKVRRAFQLLLRAWSKADDELELLITGKRVIFALDVYQFLNQPKCITQLLFCQPVGQWRMGQGVSDANKCGALRSVELPENGRSEGQPVCVNAATA